MGEGRKYSCRRRGLPDRIREDHDGIEEASLAERSRFKS